MVTRRTSESGSRGERMLAVQGVRLCVETFGRAADPALLLIAGQDSSMDWWYDELCARLAARRHVIRYDHRDTGRSATWPPGAPGYTFADLVGDALGVLDALDVHEAHVAGISMGGAIAQWLAVTHPERVRTLTLLATSGALPGLPDDLPDMAPDFAAIADAGGPAGTDPEAVVARLLSEQRALAGPGFDEARTRTVVERVVARTADLASLGNHAHTDGGPQPDGTLADIAAPTLVIHGDADPLFPLPHGEALARVIPGAELLVLPGAGHEVPPPSTWDTVVRVLLRHTSGGPEAEEERIVGRAEDDPVGWFEELYNAGEAGDIELPWSRTDPHPLLAEWVAARGIHGPGRAVVVGAGLGADAEYIAARGFDTTGFDVSETAVRVCRERWPGSPVQYRVADLLDLPADWRGAFDLVVEVLTVQALPVALRSRATDGVRGLLAPGGTLVVVALRAQDGVAPEPGPPYPLTRGDVEAFGAGLDTVTVRETALDGSPRWLAEFRRPG